MSKNTFTAILVNDQGTKLEDLFTNTQPLARLSHILLEAHDAAHRALALITEHKSQYNRDIYDYNGPTEPLTIRITSSQWTDLTISLTFISDKDVQELQNAWERSHNLWRTAQKNLDDLTEYFSGHYNPAYIEQIQNLQETFHEALGTWIHTVCDGEPGLDFSTKNLTDGSLSHSFFNLNSAMNDLMKEDAQ